MNLSSLGKEPEDEWGVRAVSNLSVIAARKVDLAAALLRELQAKRRSVQFAAVVHPDNLAERIVDAVAELDWGLLVTDEERKQRKLDLATRLEDLDREEIWKHVHSKLGGSGVLKSKGER